MQLKSYGRGNTTAKLQSALSDYPGSDQTLKTIYGMWESWNEGFPKDNGKTHKTGFSINCDPVTNFCEMQMTAAVMEEGRFQGKYLKKINFRPGKVMEGGERYMKREELSRKR